MAQWYLAFPLCLLHAGTREALDIDWEVHIPVAPNKKFRVFPFMVWHSSLITTTMALPCLNYLYRFYSASQIFFLVSHAPRSILSSLRVVAIIFFRKICILAGSGICLAFFLLTWNGKRNADFISHYTQAGSIPTKFFYEPYFIWYENYTKLYQACQHSFN